MLDNDLSKSVRSIIETKIFISHSDKDEAYYLTLRMALEHAGFNVWDTSEISPGRSLAEELRNAIYECRLCVFLATTKSIGSQWCSAELGAFWGAGKPVLIFLADSDLEDSAIHPQFRGAFKATRPAQLIDAIKTLELTVFGSVCKKIEFRQDVYKACRGLLKSATTIRDTTWGKRARLTAKNETAARALYREAIDEFVQEGKDYREILASGVGREEHIQEARKKREAHPNYLCRTLSADISTFPMVDIMIADNNRVLFSYPASDNPRHVQYLYAESELLAALFTQYWSDVWESSKDVLDN
ncbi:toll/interleukin-1 receptor domain-containing protein [Bradyrhizobium sp. Bra78]|uniref:toll/interleukin-1 receptor domain-containing protein n=1 Tax=Bradyrhizobium sp. Bra78 TaxID=2926010 RepID=UPI0021C732DE|nr:toll/interleukin-1 receptor domain-containing protein [Bradyrhizobium sp. Bra78]